jgi:hypothetical protein
MEESKMGRESGWLESALRIATVMTFGEFGKTINYKGKQSKIIIIEYKFNQKKKISKKGKLTKTDSKIISTDADIAIEQIKEKGYVEAFSAYEVPIFIIGILLSSEKKVF